MVIAIGPSIALVSVPGEPFTETAQAIVSQSPFPNTLFSGYSNGGFGYIPTRAALWRGRLRNARPLLFRKRRGGDVLTAGSRSSS